MRWWKAGMPDQTRAKCAPARRALTIYCDESDISGKHFGNFYGGLLVDAGRQVDVEARLKATCARLQLNDEVKWQKISTAYADKYIALVDELFDIVAEGDIKLRVMFTQNYFSPRRLSREQGEDAFFILYYQFIKHAFGLRHAGIAGQRTAVRLMFDELPDTLEKRARFKAYLAALDRSPEFRRSGIDIAASDIAEIDSKRHVLLQCVDVVLGAMQFRLNDKHKERLEGGRKRGKRTIAKERVYRHILARIQQIYPRFNVGRPTSLRGDMTNLWKNPLSPLAVRIQGRATETGVREAHQQKAPRALADFPGRPKWNLGVHASQGR